MAVADVKATIAALAAVELADLGVERIDVMQDVDWEGDPIYRITLILNRHDKLTGKRSVQFVGKVRSALGDDPAFPMVSFRSSDDDRWFRAEAA